MREIKFRAWNGREMIYNIFIKHGSVFQQGKDAFSSDSMLWIKSGFEKVEPKRIMQFTGLKDKNGKEIYEGDILHCNLGKFCETTSKVFFLEGSFCLYDLGKIDTNIANHSEIIGNIYENPELIKK